MDADAFRGDRYLRASAYHLLGWGIVGLGLTLPFYASTFGQAWPPASQWLYRVALGCAGLIWSFVCERRALKIAGPATLPRRAGVAYLASLVLTLSAVCTVVLLAQAAKYIAGLWLIAAAVLLAGLGWAVLPLYSATAAVLAAGGLVALIVAALDPGPQTPLAVVCVWSVLIGAVVIPCALWVNRRYLWRFDDRSSALQL